MTFTKQQIQDQKDMVEVLRYRREDLWNKYNEAYTKYTEILQKELNATTQLRKMESSCES